MIKVRKYLLHIPGIWFYYSSRIDTFFLPPTPLEGLAYTNSLYTLALLKIFEIAGSIDFQSVTYYTAKTNFCFSEKSDGADITEI